MCLEPGWCQLCYVMIHSWLWTKFTKGKLLYGVYIQSFVMKERTLELCFSSRWLLEQSGAKPQDEQNRTVSVHVGSPLCFPSTFSCMKIWNMFVFVFNEFYQVARDAAHSVTQRRSSWFSQNWSGGYFLEVYSGPMTPLPSLQHCLCSSSLRAQTLVKGFDMKN